MKHSLGHGLCSAFERNPCEQTSSDRAEILIEDSRGKILFISTIDEEGVEGNTETGLIPSPAFPHQGVHHSPAVGHGGQTASSLFPNRSDVVRLRFRRQALQRTVQFSQVGLF